jgi:hypothetical protein
VRLPNAQALGWRTVWGNGQLAAWDTAPTGWTTVSGITDAVGHARPANATFRAGAAGATLQVLSSRAGIAALGLNLGDSLGPGERSCWELTLTPSGGMPPHAVRLRPGGAIVDVPVPAGRSTIGLRASPLVPTPASVNASAREAIFNNLTVRLQPTAPAIATDGTRPAASVQAPCEGS